MADIVMRRVAQLRPHLSRELVREAGLRVILLAIQQEADALTGPSGVYGSQGILVCPAPNFGNRIGEDIQRRKLELVVEVANEVWRGK